MQSLAPPHPSREAKGSALIYPGGDLVGVQEQLLNFSTVATIVGAGLQGNNAPPLAPGCPTGNCTRTQATARTLVDQLLTDRSAAEPKSIPTLAMCGGCTDVTHKLDRQGTCDWDLPPCNESNTLLCGTMGAESCT